MRSENGVQINPQNSLFESGKLDISLYWIWVEIILGQTQKNSRIPALKRPEKEAQSLHRPVGDRIAKVPLGMGVTSLMVVSSCSLWKNDDLSPFILVISPIHMDISTVNCGDTVSPLILVMSHIHI